MTRVFFIDSEGVLHEPTAGGTVVRVSDPGETITFSPDSYRITVHGAGTLETAEQCDQTTWGQPEKPLKAEREQKMPWYRKGEKTIR